MNIIVLLLIILLLFGGLGGLGYRQGWVNPGFGVYGGSGLVLIVLVVILVLVFR
jgi:hypothetical protein